MSSPSALFSPEAEPPQSATVREIKESPRKPGRYIVVLSTGQECVVGVDTLADVGATRVGTVLQGEALQRFLRAAAVTALVDRALNALARGRRTRRELELRLRRHEPDRALIVEALDRLELSGVLSDAEVARAEAASRLRRGEAPLKIRQTLRRKGVDSRSTEGAIAEAIEHDGFDELSACRLHAERRWKSLSSLEPLVARRRLMSFLQRRGYSGQVIRAVAAELSRS